MDSSFENYFAIDSDAAQEESSALLDNDYSDDDDESLSILHQESELTQGDDCAGDDLDLTQGVHELNSLQEQQQQQHQQDDTSSIEGVSTPTRRQSVSDRGQPLSPFSPLLRSTNTNNSTTNSSQRRRRQQQLISWQQQGQQQSSVSSSSPKGLSLIPCRRVSVVVYVKPYESADPFTGNTLQEDCSEKLCLFPLPSETAVSLTSLSINNDSNDTTTRQQQQVVLTTPERSAAATSIQATGMETQNLVAVNPMAFGKYIPTHVTMDTARLVANVANIESEDWARCFKFDQVIWPSSLEKAHGQQNRQEEESSIVKLAKSMGNDAVGRQRGSLCLGIGGTNSGKTECMFGASTHDTAFGNFGLLALVVDTVLSNLPEHAVCTLSLLGIVDEQVLVDLLGRTESNLVHIRHADNKGAVVQGLSDVPLDSMTGLGHLMRKAFSTRQQDEPRGHVIATLKVWQNGVQFDLQNHAKCTNIVLADLASGEEGDGTNTRRMASFRKSLSGLRGVLRRLLQQEKDELVANAASYRECTLTQVLQRPLEDCQAVVLACVSASAESYERTLHTLNYVDRLLVRPGKTARSPFQQKEENGFPITSGVESPTRTALFEQYGDSEAFLKSVLSDPRQRLAKVMPPRSPATPAKLELNDSADEEGYVPYDYMQIDPGAIEQSDSPQSSTREEQRGALPKTVEESMDEEDDNFSKDIGDSESSAVDGQELPPRIRAVRSDIFQSKRSDDSKEARVSLRPSNNKSLEDKKKPVVSGMESMQHKTVMSLPEESSTQLTESMTSSARTGPRALNSPDDVDGWIASFEANQEVADAVAPEERDRGEDRRSPSDDFVSRTPDWTSQAHADLDDADTIEFDRHLDGTGFPEGDDEDRGVIGHVENESVSSTPTPSTGRKVFSTPKANWPELDDDSSTVSLSSLLKNIGGERERSTRSDKSPDITKSDGSSSASERFRRTPSSHKRSPVGRRSTVSSNLETPKDAQDQVSKTKSTVMSPTEQCIGEIHILEDAVEQTKRLHNGLWETSSLSLDRLRHSQELQQRAVEEAMAARANAEAETERLEKALARVSEELEKVVREYEERLTDMERKIEKALADRDDIEKIAEEAIAAQDRLEQELSRAQSELVDQKAATESAVEEYNRERKSHQTVTRQLEMTMKSLDEMRAAHGDSKEVISQLGTTVDELRSEVEKLTEERDASRALSSDQSRIIAEQDRLKRQFEHCQEEIATLHDENEKLTSNLRDYKVRFKKAEEQQKAFRIQFESENLALQNDVDEWQRQYLEVEDARERAAQEYEEERSSLLDELSDVKKRLEDSETEILLLRRADESSTKQQDEEIDVLTSAMRELQLDRERDRELLSSTEERYEKLRSDAKEKLGQLVKERKAATKTIQRLQEENTAHSESNHHLRKSIERSEREREELQSRMTGLSERLEVEELARQEAEDRIKELESKRPTRNIHEDLDESSSRSSLHLDRFTDAEQALLREIEAEKSIRRDVSFNRERTPSTPATAIRTSEIGDIQEQRALFAQFKRDMEARYGRESSERGLVSHDAYQAERRRRLLAEELAASMASHAKDGIEKRNKELGDLKFQLRRVSDEKEAEILRLRSELHSLKRNSLS